MRVDMWDVTTILSTIVSLTVTSAVGYSNWVGVQSLLVLFFIPKEDLGLAHLSSAAVFEIESFR